VFKRGLQILLGSNTLLLILLFGVFFFGLGSYPLQVPDEARYAEVPREMVVTGDYLTPRLNGVKYFEKPALFYWLQASSIELFGMNEWSLRLWTALLAIFGCVLTYLVATRLYDRTTGLTSAGILASSALYFIMGHAITLDMAVSVFMTGTLACFLLATQSPLHTWSRFGWAMASYACVAFSVLTKGLMGLLLPGAIIFFWFCFSHQWRVLLNIYLMPGIFLFLLLSLPWHILMQLTNPEFFQFYIVEQQFLRYFTDYASRQQPFWFFIPVILIGMLPWSVFLPKALHHAWQQRKVSPPMMFLLIWSLLIFVFFSLSQSKLIPYVLPIFPALAIITGHYVIKSQYSAKLLSRMGIAAIIVYFIFVITWGFLYNKTLKPVITAVMPQVHENDEIIAYDAYFQDLPVYTQRIITIVNPRGEIRWGTMQEDTSAWTMDIPTFWQRWNTGDQRYIVFAQTKDEPSILAMAEQQSQPMIILVKTPRYFVFTNKE